MRGLVKSKRFKIRKGPKQRILFRHEVIHLRAQSMFPSFDSIFNLEPPLLSNPASLRREVRSVVCLGDPVAHARGVGRDHR